MSNVLGKYMLHKQRILLGYHIDNNSRGKITTILISSLSNL